VIASQEYLISIINGGSDKQRCDERELRTDIHFGISENAKTF
jgi:hypothetical protein